MREQHREGEVGTLLCIMPALHIPMVTQDEGPPLLAGPQEVVRPSHRYSSATHQTFAIPLTDKWIGDLATCCHLPQSPWTPCNPEGAEIEMMESPSPPTHSRGQPHSNARSHSRPLFFMMNLECRTIFNNLLTCLLFDTLMELTHRTS